MRYSNGNRADNPLGRTGTFPAPEEEERAQPRFLDRKGAHMIEKLRGRLCDGSFTETDILALLILLRPIADQESPIKEFGDAMAHRQRRQGPIQEYLAKNRDIIRRPPADRPEIIDAVFVGDRIGASLNEAFKALGVGEVTKDRADDLVVVVASLLQGISFQPSGIGRLLFGSNQTFVGAWGEIEDSRGNRFAVPVFGVRNRHAFPSYKEAPDLVFLHTGVVEVSATDGVLEVHQVIGSW